MAQLSNAGDPKVFAALFVGAAELVEDVSQVLEIQLAAATHSWQGGHHSGHGHAVVICCFREALWHVCAAEGAPTTPTQPLPPPPPATTTRRRSGGATVTTPATSAAVTGAAAAAAAAAMLGPEAGLMVEVGGPQAAATLASAACKLLSHAIRLSPLAAAGFLAPSTARALALVAAHEGATFTLRQAALSTLRAVAAELPPSVFPAEQCIRLLAVTLRERATGTSGAMPPSGRDRDGFDAELAACVNAVMAAARVGAVAAAAESLARAAAATVAAGEGAVGDVLRAATLRALRACATAQPPALTPVLASLLPHAGSPDVADVLIACLEPAFAAAAVTAANATSVWDDEIAGTDAAQQVLRSGVVYPRASTDG